MEAPRYFGTFLERVILNHLTVELHNDCIWHKFFAMQDKDLTLGKAYSAVLWNKPAQGENKEFCSIHVTISVCASDDDAQAHGRPDSRATGLAEADTKHPTSYDVTGNPAVDATSNERLKKQQQDLAPHWPPACDHSSTPVCRTNPAKQLTGPGRLQTHVGRQGRWQR
ncbi:hypothetical protein MRX96_006981 [Rhipicephalus microplus]